MTASGRARALSETPGMTSTTTDAAGRGSSPQGNPWGAAEATRTILSGALVGIANIIPGVSGGTMILALGLYERFVDAVADLTRLRFRAASLGFLGLLGGAAVAAILLAVTPIRWGLSHQQHLMFALFIGLTLGGVPVILRELRPVRGASLLGCGGGLSLMALLAFGLRESSLPLNAAVYFVGGMIASAAMVLPGVSGSYLLLVLGLYAPITEGLEEFKIALKGLDPAGAARPVMSVILPVGLGVLAGIAGLTNMLKALLLRFHAATMGVLLGLLLGSVLSLYPFRGPGPKDPFAAAAPVTPVNVALVVLLGLVGWATTMAVARLGPSGGGASRPGAGCVRPTEPIE